MPLYTTAGDVAPATLVRAGSGVTSFSVAAVTVTGAITGSVIDLGAIYQGCIANVVGNASVSAGAVKIQGSLDGTNWYDLTAAITIPTTATNTPVQSHPTAGQTQTSTNITASRFMRINVTTQTAGAAAIVLYGGY
jgi:hypothetical protein